MSPWGLFCIGPDLTHAAGAATDLDTFGSSPENLARDLLQRQAWLVARGVLP